MSRQTRNIALNAFAQVLAIPRAFVTIAGSMNAAAMLAQALYWTNRYELTIEGRSREGWFYMTRDQWENQVGLSRSEQETARKMLRERGLLEEDLREVPAKMFYRVNMDALVKALADSEPTQPSEAEDPFAVETKPPTSRRKPAKQVGDNAADQLAGIPPTVPIHTKNSPNPSTKSEPAVRVDLAGGVFTIPEPFCCDVDFVRSYRDFIQHRKQKKRGDPITLVAANRHFKMFARYTPRACHLYLEEAITKNWSGVISDVLDRITDQIAAERPTTGGQTQPGLVIYSADDPKAAKTPPPGLTPKQEAQWFVENGGFF